VHLGCVPPRPRPPYLRLTSTFTAAQLAWALAVLTSSALWLFAVLAASPDHPRRAVVSAEEPPVVLVIRSASTQAGQRRERKLFDELGFALDGFALVSQQAQRPDFAELPLSEQLAAVLPEASQAGAMVVVWLSFPLNQQVMLHVVAMGSGRALIRTIETNRSPVSESTLALMARELLGTAYLFESPKDVPLAVTEVVQKVKESFPKVEAPPPPPPPPPPSRAPWDAWLHAEANYPVTGGEDAVPVWGLALSVERELERFQLGLALEGTFADLGRPGTAGARYLSFGGALTAYRGFSVRSLSVGPCASVALDDAVFQGPSPALQLLVPRFELGLQGRSEGTEGPGVALSLTSAYSPRRAELDDSGGQVLFRTATVSLMLGFALGWRGL
jgi:hypothetical protein